jgi:hypothetical protein
MALEVELRERATFATEDSLPVIRWSCKMALEVELRERATFATEDSLPVIRWSCKWRWKLS